jgi:hypothetical protein
VYWLRDFSRFPKPRGSQHRDDVYPVDLKPKKAKTRDREKEERLRIKLLTYEQASD